MGCQFGPAPPTTTWTTVASVERRVTPLFRLVPSVTQRAQSQAVSGGVNVEVPEETPKGVPRAAFGSRGLNQRPVRPVPVALSVKEPVVL